MGSYSSSIFETLGKMIDVTVESAHNDMPAVGTESVHNDMLSAVEESWHNARSAVGLESVHNARSDTLDGDAEDGVVSGIKMCTYS